jgi:hypothetical protein
MASKVLKNKDLYGLIMSYQPLSEFEKKKRKNVISELKHFHCEWSAHRDYCYICYKYHPLVIQRYKPVVMCDYCKYTVKNLFLTYHTMRGRVRRVRIVPF